MEKKVKKISAANIIKTYGEKYLMKKKNPQRFCGLKIS